MREEKFDLQTRRLDIFFAEKFRAFFYRFADGHAGSLAITRKILKRMLCSFALNFYMVAVLAKIALVAGAFGVTVSAAMKTLSAKAKISGFTLIEVLVVLAVLFILAAMLLPSLSGSHRAPMIECLNNVKQIDLAFQIYATENGGKFPIQVPVMKGGTMEFIYSGHTFPHFQKIATYLNTPKILACPVDKERRAATNFEELNDLNISYFLNADVSTNNPSHSILAGDRFLQANGQPVKPGLFFLTTNLNMSWTPDLHIGKGSLAFADGHVEISKTDNLNSTLQNQPFVTNRLCVP
jgi:prepilin-type N-terminal cleavage/methylation domain-containing protein/prepilin-type processing-associated H-X9-DG protein